MYAACALITYRFRAYYSLSSGLRAHPRERTEGIICQNVDTLNTHHRQHQPGPKSRGRYRGRAVHTLWFVLRLSTCFLKTSVHRSLHRNLITSRVSLNRGRSLENLFAGVRFTCQLVFPHPSLVMPRGYLPISPI